MMNADFFRSITPKRLGSLVYLTTSALLLSSMGLSASHQPEVKNERTEIEYADLQIAIDAANNGDTLTVSGTFIGNFFINKDLFIKGHHSAVLDGNQTGSVVTVGNVSDIVATLEDLTIQNGNAATGGGINNSATLTLIKVKVENNTSTGAGGGISNISPTAHLSLNDVKIENNIAATDGGGVNNSFAGLVINKSKINHNTANGGNGGGLYNDNGISIVVITDTEFENNSAAAGFGGAIYLLANQTAINDSKVKENSAGNGGGIYNDGGSLLSLFKTDIERNIASQNGGGVYNNIGTINFSHLDIKHNSATTGGGILNTADQPTTFIKTKVKHNRPNDIVTVDLI